MFVTFPVRFGSLEIRALCSKSFLENPGRLGTLSLAKSGVPLNAFEFDVIGGVA